MRPDIVVKVGGSLLSNPQRLGDILKHVGNSPRRVLIVPGGGVFADTVRRVCRETDTGDGAGHDMAVLAMHQTGLLFRDVCPDLKLVDDLKALSGVYQRGGQAVAMAAGWLEDCGRSDQSGKLSRPLPKTWAATSDAIAAWIALEAGAGMLVYIKSCNIPVDPSLVALRDHGIVDPVCVDVLEGAKIDVRCFGPEDAPMLQRVLSGADHVCEHGV